MGFLIQHYKHLGSAVNNSLKVYRKTVCCSHSFGQIITDSRGRKYEVQSDFSIRRIK